MDEMKEMMYRCLGSYCGHLFVERETERVRGYILCPVCLRDDVVEEPESEPWPEDTYRKSEGER